ncbi:hypothetical protein GALL_125840 [mine drainage metagenome]|uniref:Gylcosyl hydrolase 115 C-terminal domain-containing protein n=1 Tax=mine drainage metagenome TaxID=410659 RepID=A0A1J5SMM4_9ZZZZ
MRLIPSVVNRRTLAFSVLLILSVCLCATRAQALGEPSFVSHTPVPDGFALAGPSTEAPLLVDPADWPGVVRATHDLQADVERVTGRRPALQERAGVQTGTLPVLIGTVGKSALIDALVANHRLDVSAIRGKWESFVIQVVDNPLPGVAQALVVAGSDKRGTIYGIYDISQQIGVSPWYWWADVPVRHSDALYITPGRTEVGPPAVKYRGIFLNDEAPALTGWAAKKFGGLNHHFYEKVFELLLRLRANYLWPAMWNNAFNEDDPLDPKLADEYGIVMGTSHHEPMLRAQQEWKRHGKGPWNYATNGAELRRFWAEGIKRNKAYESIITVGMRGDGDMPMSRESNVALLERIVADQRAIIARETGKPADQVPQLWALYKEVQDYYEKGMRVPDDVTLLWCDDNWGDIRRLPTPAERSRSGGAGIYYHFDYVGGPRSYKWINTNPITKVWEQMHLAVETDATRIWIVNVGDLKPMEFPIEFFLDYAWNPSRWNQDNLGEFTRLWAAREFGSAHAAEIARLVEGYTKLNGNRKPELLAPGTYSITNYDEADRVVSTCDNLVAEARRVGKELPAADQNAYFELVLHPVEATATVNELYIAAARNRLYAVQGRASTNTWADRARTLFAEDAALSYKYNHVIAGGKWDHMMDQTHIGYTYWNEPECNAMPAVTQVQVLPGARLGVSIDGTPLTWPSHNPFIRPPSLRELSPYDPAPAWIELFNRGDVQAKFEVTTSAPWLTVPQDSGTLAGDLRLPVSVDWSRAPEGRSQAWIEVRSGGEDLRIAVPLSNPSASERAAIHGFVETDGVVSIEAQHFDKAVDGDGTKWTVLPGYGRTLSAVTTLPGTAASSTPGGASPHIDYTIHLFKPGEVAVDLYAAPTLAWAPGRGVRCAVSIDEGKPVVVDFQADRSEAAWNKAVSDSIRIAVTHHAIAAAGDHVLRIWRIDPDVVLEKIVVDAGGLRPSYLGPFESRRAP